MANAVIGALRVNLGLDSANFGKGLKQAQSSMQKFGKKMAIAGAGISAAGAGISLAIRSQLNAADSMSKAAQKIGIPTDELSRLSHAADMSGVSMGTLQGAVGRLSKGMSGTPDKFKKLGIAVRDVNGDMRPTSEVMQDVAQVLADMPDGAEKTALAMDLMGRSGAELIPMLNGGADALRDMLQEADDLGIVITPEMGKAAEAFNDNISRLTKQMGGMWTMITANLAPALVKLSDFAVRVATGFRNMSPAMQKFISFTAGAVVVLGPLVTGLGLMMMGAAPFVAAMGSMAVAIKGIALAMAANPIGIAVAAIAGAAYLIYREWDKVGPYFQRMWDGVKAIFEGFKNFVVGIFTGDLSLAADGIRGAWAGLDTFFTNLMDGISFAFEMMDKRIKGPIERIKSALDFADRAGRATEGFLGRITGGGVASGGTTAPAGADVVAPSGDMRSGLAGGTAGIRVQGTTDAEAYGDGFREGMGIRSPSRVMMEYGEYMSQGLGRGIIDGQPYVDAASADLGQSFADRIQPYFESVISGTESVREAFSRMLQDMASRLLSSGLEGLLGSVFGGFKIPGFANGVTNFKGGLARINERGGELVSLPNGSTVIPHDLSRQMVRAQPSQVNVVVTPNPYFDAHVSDIADISASRMGAELSRSLPSQVNRINAQPRRR